MFLLTLNKMRHTLLYNSTILLVTVRRLGIRYLGSSASQNSLKPIPSTTLIGLMSLHMNEIHFCVQASCRAAGNELVTDGAKYPDVAVSLKFHILCHIHLDAHFGDVASSC